MTRLPLLTPSPSSAYPEREAERDAWIVAQRPERNAVDPNVPYAFLLEEELSHAAEIVPVATIFLTNRECPWRCVMCDLWKNTLRESGPPGAIPRQIRYALGQLPAARQLKLYNSGSYFDPRAVPPSEDAEIAALLAPFERVVVESHPALVGERAVRLRGLLAGRLEVAMGLETVHPEALARLNKRMTLANFREAAEFLRANDMDLRVFVLVQPPFVPAEEAMQWVQRSIEFAFDCGATVVSVIPTRGGNGAMERLERASVFEPPGLGRLEAALEFGLGLGRGRVFADLWDLERDVERATGGARECASCRGARVRRLDAMNRTQRIMPRPQCQVCAGAV